MQVYACRVCVYYSPPSYTHVSQCFDDVKGIPVMSCNFVSIANIESIEPNSLIGRFLTRHPMCMYVHSVSVCCAADVIGVCKSSADVAEITTKTNRKVQCNSHLLSFPPSLTFPILCLSLLLSLSNHLHVHV